MAIGVTFALDFAESSIHFTLWAGPFVPFSEHDVMNVLGVKFELLHRFECVSAESLRM